MRLRLTESSIGIATTVNAFSRVYHDDYFRVKGPRRSEGRRQTDRRANGEAGPGFAEKLASKASKLVLANGRRIEARGMARATTSTWNPPT
jgi:hypothetical protein